MGSKLFGRKKTVLRSLVVILEVLVLSRSSNPCMSASTSGIAILIPESSTMLTMLTTIEYHLPWCHVSLLVSSDMCKYSHFDGNADLQSDSSKNPRAALHSVCLPRPQVPSHETPRCHVVSRSEAKADAMFETGSCGRHEAGSR